MNLLTYMQMKNFSGLSLEVIKKISISLLFSLVFLKELKIIHADIKPENVLFITNTKFEFKLIDFGTSCYENNLIYKYIQSRYYRAPEVALSIKYTSAIDMWSFGCLLCELYRGIPIFQCYDNVDLIYSICEYLGLPPKKLVDESPLKTEYFDEDYMPYDIMNDDGILRTPNSKKLKNFLNGADKDFINLIQKCLKWDYNERITPIEAINHPWIMKNMDISKVENLKTKINKLMLSANNCFRHITSSSSLSYNRDQGRVSSNNLSCKINSSRLMTSSNLGDYNKTIGNTKPKIKGKYCSNKSIKIYNFNSTCNTSTNYNSIYNKSTCNYKHVDTGNYELNKTNQMQNTNGFKLGIPKKPKISYKK